MEKELWDVDSSDTLLEGEKRCGAGTKIASLVSSAHLVGFKLE